MKKIIYSATLFAVMALTGCSNEMDEQGLELSNGQVRLGNVTRTTANGGTTTEWEDQSKMTVQDLTSGAATDYEFTYSVSTWNKSSGGEFYWPVGGGNLKINAFLQMMGAEANKITMPLNSDFIDQTTEENMEACDFLYYTGEVTPGDALAFNLKHSLAKLTVNITLGEGFSREKYATLTGVTSASFSSPDGMMRESADAAWSAADTKKTLNAYVSGLPSGDELKQTMTALVVPGVFDETITLKVKLSDEKVFETTAKASGFVFEANKAYATTLNLINTGDIIVATMGEISVEEWNSSDTDLGNPDSETSSEILPPWDGNADIEFAGGTGTAEDPYQIKTPGQLKLMANNLNNSVDGSLSACYKLIADIDLNNQEWQPMVGASDVVFNGCLDGSGYTISGLNIQTVSSANNNYYYGLFGYVKGGSIKNLTVFEPHVECFVADVTGTFNIGILAGQNAGATVENCHIVGGHIKVAANTAAKETNIGAIAGLTNGGYYNACSSWLEINSKQSSNIGGIVGYDRGTANFVACYTNVKIQSVGGIAGGIYGNVKNGPTIQACYSLSIGEKLEESESGTLNFGGLAGNVVASSPTVIACYYTAEKAQGKGNEIASGATKITSLSETEVNAMNNALSSINWEYVQNTDNETKDKLPYIIQNEDN